LGSIVAPMSRLNDRKRVILKSFPSIAVLASIARRHQGPTPRTPLNRPTHLAADGPRFGFDRHESRGERFGFDRAEFFMPFPIWSPSNGPPILASIAHLSTWRRLAPDAGRLRRIGFAGSPG